MKNGGNELYGSGKICHNCLEFCFIQTLNLAKLFFIYFKPLFTLFQGVQKANKLMQGWANASMSNCLI
jgi:hypothetical protein